MSSVTPGWYPDPAEPSTQRYWDGGGWVGAAIPADATPPDGPPADSPPANSPPPEPVTPTPPAPETGPGAAQAGPVPAGSSAPGASGHPFLLTYPKYPGPPEPHGMRLAGLGARFVARLVDVLALIVLCSAANALFAYQWWQIFKPIMRQVAAGETALNVPSEFSSLLLLMCVVTTAVWLAYEVPSTAASGQTLGKRIMGITVVRMENTEPLGFGRALRRWLRFGLPTLLWTFCGVGFVLQLMDCGFAALDRPLRQALHDKAAATVVVQVPRPSTPPRV